MAQSQPKGWQNTLERLYRRHNPSQVYRDAVNDCVRSFHANPRSAVPRVL